MNVGVQMVPASSLAVKNNRGLPSLFAGGEDGFLCSPLLSDSLHLYKRQSNTGPRVISDGDACGILLDEHSWGGPDVFNDNGITGSNLAVPGSWTMSVAGGTSTATESPNGTLNLFGDGTNDARGDQSFTTVVGKTYIVKANIAGGFTCWTNVGTSQGGTQNQSVAQMSNGTHTTLAFVASATTTWIRFFRSGASVGTLVVSDIKIYEVKGNHLLQATSTKRPLWKTNSGRPYLLPDGTDDILVSGFIPTANLTMAMSCQMATASKVMLGGGNSTGNKRAYIGLDASGFLEIGWGTAIAEGANDRRNTDITVVVTGDGTGRDVYVNGALVSAFGAPSGAPDGTGGGFGIGGFNNNSTPANWNTGRVYGALAMNRRATVDEIAYITAQLRSMIG
jgi:hypothetical protein